MKIFRILFTIILYFYFCFDAHSQNVYIPDDNFEQALIDLGYDSGELNDSVPAGNVDSIFVLNIPYKQITNLKGIEHFASLRELHFQSNFLNRIDLSKNIHLEVLNCSRNQLFDLDLGNNANLRDLDCSQNNLLELNIKNGNNINLTLNADYNNNLLCIQVDDTDFAYSKPYWEWRKSRITGFAEDCAEMEEVMTFIPDSNFEKYLIGMGYDIGEPDGYVPTISIRGVKEIDLFYTETADLTGLEDFEYLESLDCSYNQIVTIDVSLNFNLRYLRCTDNQLSSLNLRNGNNANMSVDFTGNPNLFCVEVDDPEITSTYSSWKKLPWTEYTDDCFGHKIAWTYVPDDIFEKRLIELGLDFGELDDSVATVAIRGLETLVIHSREIQDLTGLEDFVSLKSFRASSKYITTLDMSPQKNLKYLHFSYCDQLTYLNVSENTELEELICTHNGVETLDVTSLKNLKKIDFYTFGSLTSLDLSQNSQLTYVTVGGLQFASLNIQNGNNVIISHFNTRNNRNLTCIQVDDPEFAESQENWYTTPFAKYTTDCSEYKPKMTYVPDNYFEGYLYKIGYDNKLNDSVITLGISKIKILDLVWVQGNIQDLTGIEDFVALEELYISSGSDIKIMDLSKNFKLKIFDCFNCGMNTYDLSSNVNLERLSLNSNGITNLDLTSNAKLQFLYCNNNNLNRIDLSNNLLLQHIEISGNKLTEIDVSANKNLVSLQCSSNQIDFLDLSANKEFRYLNSPNSMLRYINLNNFNRIGGNIQVQYNPGLSCIEVDNVEEFQDKWSIHKDPWTEISLDCGSNCTFIYSKTNIDLPEKSYRDSIRVSTYHTCEWEAIEDCDWLTILSGSGVGSGYMVFDVDENYSPSERKCEIIIGADTITISQDGIHCDYNLSIQGIWFSVPVSMEKSFTIETSPLCEWTASSDCDWVTITSKASGMGSDTVFYAISENTLPVTRHCTIRVENEVIRVSQDPANCTPVFFEDHKSFGYGGGESIFYFDIQFFCKWNVAVDSDWIILTSTDYGTNPGSVVYTVKANDSYESRECEIWVNDKAYVIHQNGLPQVAGVAGDEYSQLINIYKNLNGSGWPDNNWLDTTNMLVGEWQGVTIKDNHIEALDLSGFNLEGDVSNLFLGFDSLMRLDLSNNNLYGSFAESSAKSGAEDIVNNMLNLDYLNIANNRFTFGDLESSADVFSKIPEFIYFPQASLTGMDTSVYKNESIVLLPKNYIPGYFDVYEWEKNGNQINDERNLKLEIVNATPADTGFYQQVISNTLFPGLQLTALHHLSVLTPVGAEVRVNTNYRVFPNPAKDKIYIDTQSKVADVRIYSLTGSLLMEKKDINSEWITVEHLTEGVYNIMILPKDSGTINFLLVINRK